MRAAGEVMRQRIVRGIQELTTRNNRPPTNRELGECLGGKSAGHIDYHLRILREKGLLMHDPKKSRGIMLVNLEPAFVPAAQPRMLRIPFFFSSRRRHTRFDCDWSSDVCSSD